jgi:23S rRNA A1618 N6-methylase RlmF
MHLLSRKTTGCSIERTQLPDCFLPPLIPHTATYLSHTAEEKDVLPIFSKNHAPNSSLLIVNKSYLTKNRKSKKITRQIKYSFVYREKRKKVLIQNEHRTAYITPTGYPENFCIFL